MRQGLKLLVLAGSAEARQIAVAAHERGAQVQAMVSEPPRGPNPMPVPCALLDFGDLSDVVAAMKGFDAVLDASHGFDGRMSRLGFAAASQLELPFLCYARPEWPLDNSANVIAAKDVSTSLQHIHSGARVFSATGWNSLPDYAAFEGARLFLRQTNAHTRTPPFDFVELVFGQAPFTKVSESDLFQDLSIDTLICRNLGGEPSRPKVDAAVDLGLKIILIARPALPKGAPVVGQVEDALAWVERQ